MGEAMAEDHDPHCMESAAHAALVPSTAPAELPQKSMYKLMKCGGVYYVEHIITGEKKALPEGYIWSLGDRADRVFAWAHGVESIWMGDFLRSSLWLQHERVMLSFRAEGGEPSSVMWLDDVSKQFTIGTVKIEIKLDDVNTKVVQPKYYAFSLPRRGARVFIELNYFKELVAVGSQQKCDKFIRDGLRLRWRPWLQKICGVPDDHFLQGSSGLRRGTVLADFLIHQNAVSVSALLKLAFHWGAVLANPSARLQACRLMQALLVLLPKDCKVVVLQNIDDSEDPSWVEVSVIDGVLAPSPELQQQWSGDYRGLWPFAPLSVLELPCALRPLNDAKIGFNVLDALARTIEVPITKMTCSNIQLVQRLSCQDNYYLDPHMKRLTAAMGRNVFRTSSFTKSLALRVQSNATRERTLERGRYWMSTRKAMSSGTTWAIAPDATRFAGKDWQCMPVCSVDNQLYAWAPPVVLDLLRSSFSSS